MIGDLWGVSESETLRTYPCDGFVASPTLQAWRGVRVEAPSALVWAGFPQPRVGEAFSTAAGAQWAGSFPSTPAAS